jgi:hypothetical protein
MNFSHYQQVIALSFEQDTVFLRHGKKLSEMVTEGEPILPATQPRELPHLAGRNRK